MKTTVIKRTGEVVDFDLNKISEAIKKAMNATKTEIDEDILEKVALRAYSHASKKAKDGSISVEDIQDSVEATLYECGFDEAGKAYILYRKNHEALRERKLDYKNLMEGYIKSLDWRVKENSTVTMSLGGLILGNSGAVTANYWLSEVYDKEIADAHRNGDMHIHDLSMFSGYCAGWSLRQLIKEGIGGVPDRITSAPASHLSTLCNQMVNFLGILQNEWAG